VPIKVSVAIQVKLINRRYVHTSMALKVEAAELYSVFKGSPLLTEATKLIVEADQGISVTEIAQRLHKKAPTIHRALQKLRSLSLVTTNKEGRNVSYRILPGKKTALTHILAQLYYPTESFVVGELSHPTLKVHVSRDVEFTGICFKHRIPLIYEYTEFRSGVKEDEVGDTSSVGILVLTRLDERDMLSLVGEMFDLHKTGVNGYILAVVEDGISPEDFSRLDRFFDDLQDKLDVWVSPVLVEKKDPLKGLKQIQDIAADWLRQ